MFLRERIVEDFVQGSESLKDGEADERGPGQYRRTGLVLC